MTKAARVAYAAVQKVNSHIDSITSGELPKSSSSSSSTPPPPSSNNAPLHHEELTQSDHARAQMKGSDFMSQLRRAKEQVKSDAAADWQDIKRKFGGN